MADGGKAAARPSVGHGAEEDEFVGHWGRMGHLTPEQSAVTETFTAKQEAALKLTKYPPESLQNTALRFLRARKFDPEASAVLLAKCNEMKAAGGAARFAALPADECSRCNVAALKNFYPHTMSGFDKQNRPILWEISGALNVPAIQTMCHKDALMSYHWWTMETKLGDMFQRAAERVGPGVASPNATCAILDFAGFGVSHLTPACLNQLKAFISVDNTCYPETLGKLLAINAPWVAVNAWGMVKGLLDPRTVTKIEILSPADSIKRLHELIDAEHIPPMYGGTGPDLYFPKANTEFCNVPRGGELVKSVDLPAASGAVVETYVADGGVECSVMLLSAADGAKFKGARPGKFVPIHYPSARVLAKKALAPADGVPERMVVTLEVAEAAVAHPAGGVLLILWTNAARFAGRNVVYTVTVTGAGAAAANAVEPLRVVAKLGCGKEGCPCGADCGCGDACQCATAAAKCTDAAAALSAAAAATAKVGCGKEGCPCGADCGCGDGCQCATAAAKCTDAAAAASTLPPSPPQGP